MTVMATDKPAVELEYVEVHRETWSESRPAQRGAPAGADHFTRVYERVTHPEDGAVREHCWLWIGDEPGRRNAVISHSSYPADQSPLADLNPLPDDVGDPMPMATEKPDEAGTRALISAEEFNDLQDKVLSHDKFCPCRHCSRMDELMNVMCIHYGPEAQPCRKPSLPSRYGCEDHPHHGPQTPAA